jgi:integrase
MARTARNARLQTRTGRLKLPLDRKLWQQIGPGMSLGYRRGVNSATWYSRIVHDGKPVQQTIGSADDLVDANGADILTYFQAADAVRALADNSKTGLKPKQYTVADAVAAYLEWFKAHRKSLNATRNVFNLHVLPYFSNVPLSSLTTSQLNKWFEELPTRHARWRSSAGRSNIRTNTDPRARKATSNRVLSTFKAALNYAWRNEMVVSDDAWRRVKPFRNVDHPRIRYLSIDETRRLINTCDPDLRQIAQAALLTGCRYGEIAALRVEDFIIDARSIHIRDSKSGKPRNVPLNDEGITFFARACAVRHGNEFMFIHPDGSPWGNSHQIRPMREACERAGIVPAIGFHILRHTYASQLVMAGAPIEVVSVVLGHADTRVTIRHYAHLAPSYVADVVRNALPTLGMIGKDNVVPLGQRSG